MLLVDEDTSSLDLFAKWLRAKKYVVTTCFSGDEAHDVLLAAMRSCVSVGEAVSDIDVILADASLQVPSGGVILDYVLGSSKLKHIPVICEFPCLFPPLSSLMTHVSFTLYFVACSDVGQRLVSGRRTHHPPRRH